MAAKLRAGLIGLGMMGRNHARVLRSLDGVELVAVADPAGDKFGAADGITVVSDVQSLIEQGLDMCVVAAPTAHHVDVGLALAEAGVHTLIEKPLAVDEAGATQLAEAFEKAGLVGCVGHIERYNPALRELRRRLDEGELGEVFQVVTRRQGPFPNRIADVGVVMDLATHDIDLTAWVTRQPYAAVSAQTAYRSGREHEDLVSVTGQLGDGTVVSHLVNWLSPMKERVTVVTGERGCFVADTLTADLTFFANGQVLAQWDALTAFRGVTEGDVIRFAMAKAEPLRTQHEAFRDAVEGKDADVVTMRQGMATVTVARACIRSAKEQRTVTFEQVAPS